MALRFPQPASPSTPITSPSSTLFGGFNYLAVWPVAKDEFHTFVSGDANSTYRTRSATTGTSFNATEGQIETTVDANVTYDVPSGLISVGSGTDFTMILVLDRNINNGGGASTRTLMSAVDGSGWGVFAETTSGGSTPWVNYNNGASSWSVPGVGLFDTTIGEQILIYRHQSGSQKYQVNGTVKGTSSVSTPDTGKLMGTAGFPLKIGTGFFAASNQRTYFKGFVLVAGALSDTQIANIVGASGLLITSGSSVPNAPSAVTASSIGATTVTAGWTDNSSDETSFEVQTSPSPYSTWTAASGSPTAANATSLGITGLTSGVTYKIRVRATNGGGSSAWVESSPFTTLTAPAAPTGVTATSVTGTSATAGWTDASSNEASFEVQSSPSPYSTWTAAPASPAAANATSLSVTGLSGATTYKIRVRATNAAGSSAWVESSPFTTQTRKLQLLVHPKFIGATSVKVAVFAAPTGGNLTGAKIGEFTGTFSGVAGPGGAAVLKQTVSTFGGGSLLLTDTPVAVFECTTSSTSALGNAVAAGSSGVHECTVIDE